MDTPNRGQGRQEAEWYSLNTLDPQPSCDTPVTNRTMVTSVFSSEHTETEIAQNLENASSEVSNALPGPRTSGRGFAMRDGNWKRPQWSYSIHSVFICIGFALAVQGLLNERYVISKHGGALFLVPFIVSEILIGLPCTFLMLSLGQFTSSGVITCWHFSPIFTGFGVVFITVCFLNTMMLQTEMTHFLYLFRLQDMPISSCKNWSYTFYTSSGTISCGQYIGVISAWQRKQSGYDDLWGGALDSIGDVNWKLALLFLGTVIIIASIASLETIGKVLTIITAGVIVVIPIVLFILGLTLPGANEMANLLWKPDASKLKEIETWSHAFLLSLYRHGISTGAYITIGSFNHFHNDCFRDSLIIVVTTTVWSIFGTHAMFCIAGYVMKQTDTETDYLGDWLFYPEAMLSILPEGKIWIAIFDFYIICAIIQYGATYVFTIVTGLEDCFPRIFKNRARRLLLLVILCITLCLLSLPMTTPKGATLKYYLNVSLDRYHLQTLVVVLLLPVIGFFYGVFRFSNDIGTMNNNRVCGCLPWTLIKYPFIFLWTFGTFYTLLAAFVLQFLSWPYYAWSFEEGEWNVHLANFINVLLFGPIPLCAFGTLLYFFVKTPGDIRTKLNAALKPTKYWGPLKPENRRKVFDRWKPYGFTEDPWTDQADQTENSTSRN